VYEFLDAQHNRLVVALRPDSVAVSVNAVPSYSFDLGGRLIGAFVAGRSYRRTLDNRLVERRWHEPPDEIGPVRELPPAEARAFLEQTYAAMAALRHTLDAGEWQPLPPLLAGEGRGGGLPPLSVAGEGRGGGLPPLSATGEGGVGVGVARRAFDLIQQQSPDGLEADARRFRAIYKPIAILPPDQYRALVLQATAGCAYNRCTFCHFYKDTKFHRKSLPEFRQHIQAVRDYFGPAIVLRRSIFLADANALVIPQRPLLALLDAVHAAFAIAPADLSGGDLVAWRAAHPGGFDGLYSFVDAFTGRRKTTDDFIALRARGLRRVYIGLESGDDALLDFLGKAGSAADAVQVVTTLQAARVAVGVIVLLGVGGGRYAEQHIAHTIEAINAMRLGRGDIVYFSQFVDWPGSEYARRAAAAGIVPLSGEQVRAQRAAMQAGFAFPDPTHPPKLALYDIRRFVY